MEIWKSLVLTRLSKLRGNLTHWRKQSGSLWLSWDIITREQRWLLLHWWSWHHLWGSLFNRGKLIRAIEIRSAFTRNSWRMINLLSFFLWFSEINNGLMFHLLWPKALPFLLQLNEVIVVILHIFILFFMIIAIIIIGRNLIYKFLGLLFEVRWPVIGVTRMRPFFRALVIISTATSIFCKSASVFCYKLFDLVGLFLRKETWNVLAVSARSEEPLDLLLVW